MPTTYFGYIGTWASRPNATTLDIGSEMTVTDVPAAGRSRWYSDGTNWVPEGGAVTLCSLGGGSATSPVASQTGSGNQLLGLPNGAIKIPAGLIVPGRSILQINAYYRKTGSNGNLNFDLRIGTTSSFSDSQLLNVGGAAADRIYNAQVDCSFANSGRLQTVSSLAAANAGTATGVGTGEETTSINTNADMYINVGYNGASSGDGLTLTRLLVRLFM